MLFLFFLCFPHPFFSSFTQPTISQPPFQNDHAESFYLLKARFFCLATVACCVLKHLETVRSGRIFARIRLQRVRKIFIQSCHCRIHLHRQVWFGTSEMTYRHLMCRNHQMSVVELRFQLNNDLRHSDEKLSMFDIHLFPGSSASSLTNLTLTNNLIVCTESDISSLKKFMILKWKHLLYSNFSSLSVTSQQWVTIHFSLLGKTENWSDPGTRHSPATYVVIFRAWMSKPV